MKTEAASRTSSHINFHIIISYTHIWLFGWLIVDNNNSQLYINRLMKMLLMIVIAPINKIKIIKIKCSQNGNNLNGSNKTYLRKKWQYTLNSIGLWPFFSCIKLCRSMFVKYCKLPMNNHNNQFQLHFGS